MAIKTHLAKQEEAVTESGIQQRSSDPGVPVANQAWINLTTDELKVYDGSSTHTIGGSGSGGGSTSSADVSTQQGQLQKAGLLVNPLKDCFVTNLKDQRFAWKAQLLENYTSGTTNLKYVVNNVALDPTDKNTTDPTNWTVFGAGTNIGTSGTFKLGPSSISFDKDNTAVEAGVYLDCSPEAGLSLNAIAHLWGGPPSLTNFASLRIAYSDTTSFTDSAYWDITTDIDGDPITTGLNLCRVDLRTAPTGTTGAGWSYRGQSVARFRYSVITTTSTQTYTGVLLNGLAHGDSTGSFYQKGLVLDGFDASFLDQFLPDSSNTDYQGNITLAASVAQSYTATLEDTGFKLVRTSMEILGDGYARRDYGLSGEVIQTQVLRQRYKLSASGSNMDFEKVVGFDTTKVLEVTAINSGVSIEVYDPADWSAQFLNTNTIRVIEVAYSDGQGVYQPRGINPVLDGNATHLSGTTTIPLASTTGISVGDLIFKDQITEKLSVTADGVNESLSAMTFDRIEVVNAGLPYIDSQYLVGHYFLGGPSNEGIINRYGGLANLTENGAIANDFPFAHRQFAAGTFSTANYFSLTTAQSAALKADGTGPGTISGAMWIKLTSAPSAGNYALIGSVTGAQGWGFAIKSTGNIALFTNGTEDFATSNTITADGNYHLLCWSISGPSTTAYIWLDDVLTSGTQNATDNTTSQLVVGYDLVGGDELDIGVLADLLLWSAGPGLTTLKQQRLYNAGNPLKYGSLDSYFLHYIKTGTSGLWVTNETTVSAVTDDDDIAITNNAISRTA